MGLNDDVHLKGRTALLPSESKTTCQRHDAGVSFTFTLFNRAAVHPLLYSPVETFHVISIPSRGMFQSCSEDAAYRANNEHQGQLKEDLRIDRLFTSWHE